MVLETLPNSYNEPVNGGEGDGQTIIPIEESELVMSIIFIHMKKKM